ncbi:MAG: hypothetical protein US69_C0002G0023 [candidate division TM6 bacterium GW2011_GWF2_38_10]|nr:MAG: hypothetical protein US69_C0002G0023 [candidate division TM6 bacterium GW2011_GWF2_38_10]
MIMVRLLVVLCVSMLFPNMACATNYREIFFQANDLFKEGKYEEAYDLYEKIPNKSSHVHYNLGVCAYKLGKKGYALVHWRRAEKDWGFFNRAELINNIDLVLKKETPYDGNDTKTPGEFTKERLNNFSNKIVSAVRATPLLRLQLLFLFLWIFAFVYLRYWYRQRQKFLIVIVFFAIIISGMLLVVRYNFDLRQHGVVVTNSVVLYSGPGDNYQKLTTLTETNQVLIKGESDGFYKVKQKGIIGWLDKKTVLLY